MAPSFFISYCKVKLQPSVEEYRRRYLDNIEKLVLNQTKLVTFSATLTENIISEKKEDLESNKKDQRYTEEKINSSLPFFFLNGKIGFNLQLAKNLPCDSDLRVLRNLWSGKNFLHDQDFVITRYFIDGYKPIN